MKMEQLIWKGGLVRSSAKQRAYGIYNYSKGTINVNGGEVSCSSDGEDIYGIINRGIVNVNGGKVSSSGYLGICGIYNVSSGIINVNGGEISSNITSNHSSSNKDSGICNQGTGIINVNGGKVSSSADLRASGIRNNNKGTINVNGGKISSSAREVYGIYNMDIGIINVNEGEISSNGNSTSMYAYGIYNYSKGTINVNGGEVNSSGRGIPSGIYNYDEGIVNVNGGEVSGSSYGIYNFREGKINLKRGKVSSSEYGIYNYGTGVINLGIREDGVVNNITPSINAGNYGISNVTGECYFYDGIISGNTRFCEGGITEIEEGYQIKEDNIDGFNSIYLEEQTKEKIYVVRNKNTKEEYTTLQEAINKSPDFEETELILLQDINLTIKLGFQQNKNIVLDLAGNIITNKYIYINNMGDLTIKDSVGGGELDCETKIGINNKGNLEVEGRVVSGAYGIYNWSEGTININGGEVSGSSYGIYNYRTGTINVNGGKVSSSGGNTYGIYNYTSGTININGGEVSSNSNGNNDANGIYNFSNGTINISGGKVSVSISNSTYSSTAANGIYNYSNGTININGGEVISENYNSKSANIYGIYNYSKGTININKGKVISKRSNDSGSYGNYHYGIYNKSTGVINLGTKGDGIVSNTSPSINAGTYGISNTNGKFYFYDGRIEGGTSAMETNSIITAREENTELLYEENDKILTLTTEPMDIAKIGEVTYSSLQDAINAAGTEKTTIELLRGIQYTNQDVSIAIAENQDITLDLKGFSIVADFEDAVFTNQGKLKITDTTEEAKGKIIGTSDKIIYNKQEGTLELNKGTITKNISNGNIVYNEGILNVTGATIAQGSYGIYNTENATLNVTEGTISGGTNGIYNIGNTKIDGGTIEKSITNVDNANLQINGGTINFQITNTGNASLQMNGGHIEYFYDKSSCGIRNTSTNTVTIAGGTIKSYYGIYSTAGTVNIGTKDGNIEQTLVITGTANGIYADCTLNIYDGIIKGQITAVEGQIGKLEDNCEIVIGQEDNYETLILVKKETPLVEVNSNQYYSLKEAIDHITTETTVTILREGTIAEIIDISAEKNITIDLNGNTIKMYNKIKNKGKLTITDLSEEKAGKLTTYKDSPIYNNGNLKIENGNISGNSYGIYNQANGTTNVIGGNITENTYGIYVVGGTVNISGGNIANNTYGIFTNSGTTNIQEGIITNNEYGVYNSNGTTKITGGNINSNVHEVYNGGTGTIEVIRGSYITTNNIFIENTSKGTIVIGTQDGSVVLEEPLIQAENYAINNSGNGTVKFYDGTIKGKTGGLLGLYLYTETGYEVETNYEEQYYCDTLTLSGTVTTVATVNDIGYSNLQAAINACTTEGETTITLVNSINTEGAFIIEEGQNIILDLNGKTIIATMSENTIENAGTLSIIDTSSNQVGKIVNNYKTAIQNTGTLTIGQNDGNVSTTCPEVSGNTHGIINSGQFKYYDGIIKAGVAVDGIINARADNYIINKTTIDGVEQLTLMK